MVGGSRCEGSALRSPALGAHQLVDLLVGRVDRSRRRRREHGRGGRQEPLPGARVRHRAGDDAGAAVAHRRHAAGEGQRRELRPPARATEPRRPTPRARSGSSGVLPRSRSAGRTGAEPAGAIGDLRPRQHQLHRDRERREPVPDHRHARATPSTSACRRSAGSRAPARTGTPTATLLRDQIAVGRRRHLHHRDRPDGAARQLPPDGARDLAHLGARGVRRLVEGRARAAEPRSGREGREAGDEAHQPATRDRDRCRNRAPSRSRARTGPGCGAHSSPRSPRTRCGRRCRRRVASRGRCRRCPPTTCPPTRRWS